MSTNLITPRIGEALVTEMSIEEVQRDPFCLDKLDLKNLKKRPRVIVSNEPIEPVLEEVPIQYFALPSCSFLRRIFAVIPGGKWLLEWALNFYVGMRLMLAMKHRDAVGLISLGKRSGSIFCFLNSFRWFHGGPILVYRVLMKERSSRLVNRLIGRAFRSSELIAVWSRAQIDNYHRVFNVPRERFIFLPYKANHSREPFQPIPVGDYIFSGGNSERDYKTLFAAVQGLSIAVVVSATNSEVIRGLTIPDNVILVGAEEPYFKRLMAGCRMVAVCLRGDIIRGSGEATILNAMWHGKPLVIADNISASNYIENGIDGFVVPAGDVEQMRRRILELWNDSQLTARMGEQAHRKVAQFYTHHHWRHRSQALAMLVFEKS